MPGLQARFTEEKQLTLLQEPLVSRGELFFAPPGRLARYVHEPAPSTLLVEDDRLSYLNAGERGTLDLDVHPMVRVFVDSFRLLFTGDLDGLRETFRIELLPVEATGVSAPRWELTLEPRDEPLKAALRSIRVMGSGNKLFELRILERNGDSTRTTFSEVDGERRFSEAELARLFRLPPP